MTLSCTKFTMELLLDFLVHISLDLFFIMGDHFDDDVRLFGRLLDDVTINYDGSLAVWLPTNVLFYVHNIK